MKKIKIDVYPGIVDTMEVWHVRISQKPKSFVFPVLRGLISDRLLEGIVKNTVEAVTKLTPTNPS